MSKRMTDLKTKVDSTKVYSLDEAIALVKATSTVKFDASVEFHARLGIDPKKSDQLIRATVVLPHGTGKTKRIAAFVGPNDEKAAKDAGADLVLGEEEIKEIKTTGKIDFDIAVATPEMMPKLAVAARVLGPKGLMPNPKTDTVDKNVAKMIEALKKGKAAFKNDDQANIHQLVGKVSFDNAKLKENIETFIEALKRAKPSGSKGTYIKTAFLTSAMGPSVKISVE
ncbi:MAG: 50S ribosomal protein L1 [Candidatus Magasanikbacteria bacterium CG_4_9_14_0_2_um_filter_41_10]|uniref:Large ribosomal subunit protein uL1 n=1 Tax=Candidatus Magasanikbacteria bacterium CG_4_10_14_0_2_um_filter_41_31 TaxID=1974639 RepID=A0A2M7V1W5_9BACT|nr:MAG: 50S ribosomal protein L1 [Candidatus Magasanikbacteria bacterium CG1_02_41_34]PIZ92218.1 MAG: 50S ribosomal protein L1 [Candidatus Magasanikbacteria bacterium CG_4_10_14_0_2_um_filter_41_31]PJC53549.1 MAG: 50S ribosomal protein L1 [Candidatus Magasanikbacteria bacterium CG_4_9_14_0_2_um_filter_41_10]